jgi:CheY-like chemotaxis protein
VEPARATTDEVPRARPGETVLVVDDQPQVRAAVGKLLSRLGYQVLVATNGEEGLSIILGSGRIDLVLTDIVMPQMRGTELADHVEAVRPGLPLVFMTGYADSEKGIEFTPAMHVLIKPLELGSLARALRGAIDS